MDIWMTARATGNPYMTLLVEHLEKLGCAVRESEPQWRLTLDALRHGTPDILHLHWMYLFFVRGKKGDSPVARLRARGLAVWFERLLDAFMERGTRIVWTAHNAHNHENRLPDIDRRCHHAVVERADGIIAHSATARRTLIDQFGIERADKVRVIPHGHYIGVYDDDCSRKQARKHLGVPQDARLLVSFGKIREYKNIPPLIESFKEVVAEEQEQQKPPVLLIAGRPESEALDARIRNAIDGRSDVHYHPEFIPDEHVQWYMKGADAVVLPYREILTSGSAVLAMSFGRPVVAPRLGTLRDVLDRQPDLLYAPDGGGGQGGLADALEVVLGLSDEALEEMGQLNYRRAQEWDWPSVGRRTVELYRDVLSR